MKATHTDYMNPRHLRVEDGTNVWCMAPSCSDYAKLNKPGLPSYTQAAFLRHDGGGAKDGGMKHDYGAIIRTQFFDHGGKIGVLVERNDVRRPVLVVNPFAEEIDAEWRESHPCDPVSS